MTETMTKTNKEIMSELLLLTPDIVKKSNYTMSEKKFNALSTVYSYIMFLMSGFQLLKDDFKPEFVDICDRLYNDSDYYTYSTVYSRIMGKIAARHGECTTREKSAQYRELANKAIKEQYADYYKVVKLFYDNKTDSEIDYLFTDPGRDNYLKLKEILEMKKENDEKELKIIELEKELECLQQQCSALDNEPNIEMSIKTKNKITFIQKLKKFFHK